MQQKMIQQVMTAPKQIEFREVPIPPIGDDQVLVKIMKIGVCGSDIHVYHGTTEQYNRFVTVLVNHAVKVEVL